MQKTSDVIWQDQQHQRLFHILDLVAEEEAGPEILDELRNYAESHFALEEAYMEILAYPLREQHLAAHDQFRAEMNEMVADSDKNDPVFRQIVSRFLTEWLKRHVFGVDKHLEAFLIDHRCR